MNLIDQFDLVRIINVPARKDRRLETVAEFERHGFKINSGKAAFFDAITPSDAKGFSSPGVRGCFLSHLGVLEEAARAKVGNVLVLEDDIQFSRRISQHGNQAMDALKNIDWDIAYFGHALASTPNAPAWAKVEQPMLLAHCYAVNGKCLERLTQFLQKILERPAGHPDGGPMHYDGALNTFIQQNPDIQAYYYTLNLGYQRPSRTDLHALSIFDTNPLLRPMTKMGRKLKARILRQTR